MGPGMAFQALAEQKWILWLILMLLSCFPPMGIKELWPPSCGPVRTSEVTAMIQMRTLRTQQQSAHSDYSKNNEPNEGNYNTSAMDANLQIIKQNRDMCRTLGKET